MVASYAPRLWPSATRAACNFASSTAAAAATNLLDLLSGSNSALASTPSAPVLASPWAPPSSAAAPFPWTATRGLCTPRNLPPTGSHINPQQAPSVAASKAAAASPVSQAAAGSTGDEHRTPSSPPAPDADSAQPDAVAPGTAPAPPSHASRRDVDAAAETVYPSSLDDNLGVQKNWFNALFSQLNVIHRTGMAPHVAGRQKEVFVAVEREFEALWERHVRGRGLQGVAHRGLLLCCLAIATHTVLRYETGDDELVKEVIRTNLGGVAEGIMLRLHRGRLWLLLRLLAEDPYKQAVRFLPSLQGDMASLVTSELAVGPGEATWTAASCAFHATLAAEDATELLPYFCCQHGMQYLEGFAQYGVRVGLEQSLGFGDECCRVRISRPRTAAEAGPAASAGEAPAAEAAPPQGTAALPPSVPPPQQQQQQ